MDRESLELAYDCATEIVGRAERDPISALRWLPLQHEFLADPYPYKQIRCGNQTIGKTTPALALMIGSCLGQHPLGAQGYPLPPPPVEWWLVVATQKVGIRPQQKLRALLPPDEIDPRTEWDPVRGYSPVNAPTVVFKNGSIIRILTTGNAGTKAETQKAMDFASATIDGVLWDEPPRNQRLFTESLQRVQERGGVVLLSYTPINAPTWYLRELCEAGTIHDHWVPLTPDQLIPVGATEPLRTADGRPKDAAWIAERESVVPSHERPVVIHGEWEVRSVARYFEHFRDGGGDSHVHNRIPTHEVDIWLGIDHGSKPGKQVAELGATWRARPDRPWQTYVVDEYTDATGRATPREDALGILHILDRNGLRWRDLSFVGGDRVHEPGKPSSKSNAELEREIRAELIRRGELRADQELYPHIRTIKRGQGRGQGSVGVRMRWLYHRTCEPDGFGVHSRCVRLRNGLNKWDLRDTEDKDPIDAVVYGNDPWIFGSGIMPVADEIVLG